MQQRSVEVHSLNPVKTVLSLIVELSKSQRSNVKHHSLHYVKLCKLALYSKRGLDLCVCVCVYFSDQTLSAIMREMAIGKVYGYMTC